MKAAKTIDEIYSEVKDHDIVISNDAALVTALNNRIGVPRIGRLASTPKMIAKDHEDAILERLMDEGKCTKDGRCGIMDDMRILEAISDATGYDVRFVHGEVQNICEIRRHRMDVEKYLHGRPSNDIYKIFAELPTYESVMSAFDPEAYPIYDGKKVAVIGIDQFSDLDKHFIPKDFDEIEMFTDGNYDIGIIYAVGNDRQVAEHAVDLITEENAEDVAIVLDTKGPISDAVRSALYRKGIGFRNSLPAKDIVSVRDYLEFIRKALSYDILTVGDVRELYASYGAVVSNKYDEYLLHRYSNIAGGKFRELSDTMRDIRKFTFSELCAKIVAAKHFGTVKMVLDGLGLGDKRINEKNEGYASYLISSMDGIPHNAEIPDSEKKGVLLADCLNSVYIDRPFVIFLNVDNAWSRPNLGKDYIDRDEEEELDLERFRALLQQGSSRIYIVNTMKNGKPARPCTLFDRLNDDGTLKRINSFRDVAAEVRGGWRTPEPPATKGCIPAAAPPRKIGDLSKSSMNSYVACPRAYMFGELIRPPDTESTVFGNMLHEFAEFCLCYPSIAKDNVGECIDMISDVCAGISCPERRELDRSRISMAVTNIMRFISILNVNAPLNTDTSSKKYRNRFFEKFNVNLTSDVAEKDVRSPRNPLHGGFDLVFGNRIIDYKTGGPQTASDIASKMDLTKKNDYYELQPFVYLSVLDDVLDSAGTREFMLFYALDNETEASDPNFDVMRNTRTVVLLNMRRSEIVRSGLLLSLVTEAESRKFLLDIGNGFNAALLRAGVDNAERWADDEALFESILALQGKRTETVKKEIRYAIKKAGEYLSGCFIKDGTRILLPRESIEAFKEYSKKIHAKISEQQITGFPCEPRKDCERCSFFDICTGGITNDAE